MHLKSTAVVFAPVCTMKNGWRSSTLTRPTFEEHSNSAHVFFYFDKTPTYPARVSSERRAIGLTFFENAAAAVFTR